MDSISPALGVIIMMNNYFHDVATGLLLASGVAMYYIMTRYEDDSPRHTTEFFLRAYDGLNRLLLFSFCWIIIAGFPRTYFYRDFEWANSVAELQVPAIIVKHVVVFAVVGTGIYMWHKYHRKVKEVRATLAADSG